MDRKQDVTDRGREINSSMRRGVGLHFIEQDERRPGYLRCVNDTAPTFRLEENQAAREISIAANVPVFSSDGGRSELGGAGVRRQTMSAQAGIGAQCATKGAKTNTMAGVNNGERL
ncbi:hypothetical protein [uncultured Rhodoblastus sp.]|uniref:hypothetical protein n=1 Tax=uncultured Rhodoblastus sp. TaxID=543037 RepID=UPI0025FAC728|nr:hypothetical protein [uncultured Rhodoblastus sp.]